MALGFEWKKAKAKQLHIVDGELHIWAIQDRPDVLVFAVDVIDLENGADTYSVIHDREQVKILVEHLEEWLRNH